MKNKQLHSTLIPTGEHQFPYHQQKGSCKPLGMAMVGWLTHSLLAVGVSLLPHAAEVGFVAFADAIAGGWAFFQNENLFSRSYCGT